MFQKFVFFVTALLVSGVALAAEGAKVTGDAAGWVAIGAGLAMGLGSQRAMLEDPGLTSSFQIRREAPVSIMSPRLRR